MNAFDPSGKPHGSGLVREPGMVPCRRWGFALLAGLAGAWLSASPALAQFAQEPENPVFVHDSPAAADALTRVREFIASGNLDQAARVLQRLLDEEPAALVPEADDPARYRSVRTRAIELLKADPELLTIYRQAQQPRAEELLTAGRFDLIRESRLLTRAGLAAALRIAGDLIEAADFDAARRALAELVDHPDLVGGTPTPETQALAATAARLAAALQQYQPAAELASWASAWSVRAGVQLAASPFIAGPVQPSRRSPLQPQPAASLNGLVAQPLAVVTFSDAEPTEPPRLPGGVNSPDQLPPTGRELRIMPELVAETLFVPGPRSIVALDRLTLQERWRSEIPALLGFDAAALEQTAAERGGPGRAGALAWEDIRGVTVREPFVLAVASLDAGVNGQGDGEAVVALDSRTGRTRWVLSPRDLSPDLERARVRGPLHVAGDTVVIGLRKELRDRRLWALYTAGISLQDGRTRWVRLLASAGALPFFRQSQVSDGSTLADGVVYRVDRLGVVAALDAGTGWPLWVRRLRPEPFEPTVASSPWQMSMPLVHGERLTILSPDRTQIITLDRRSGVIISQTPAEAFDQPAYLLALGDRLVGINEQRITIGSLADPLAGPRQATPRVPDPGIRGRIVVVGDQLLVPLAGRAWLIDPARPAKPEVLTLDHSGTFLASGDQLLAVDDNRVYAYLPWASADRLLAERIERGGDPAPAVALLELAFRAGQTDRMSFAVQAARRLLQQGDAEANREVRDRLVAVLRRVSATGLVDRPQPAPNTAEPARPVELSEALRSELLDQLGALAQSPEEKAAFGLLLARHHERGGRLGPALAAYQSVLENQAVRDALWDGETMSQRAGIDAARGLRALVARKAGGREAYAPFDQAAQAALAALPPDAEPAVIEALAERFPAARVSTALWLRVGDLHERAGRPRAAARAFELGLRGAEGDATADRVALAEAAGRLVSNLRERGLLAAADDTLRLVQTRFAGLAPTRQGQPIDIAVWSADLSRQLAQARRWPRVGAPTSADQVLTGWALLDPAIRPTIPSSPAGLVLRHEDGRVALFAPQIKQEPKSPLTAQWTSPPTEDPVELVKLDRHAALLFFATAAGGVLERVDAQTMQSAWRSRPFPELFPQAAGQRVVGDRVRTPTDGLRLAEELLVCVDERSVGLVERTGRTAMFDADTGTVLWSSTLPISRVFDADVAGDLLAVAGELEEPGAPGGLMAPKAALIVIEARTGRIMSQAIIEGGPIRWLRVTSRGELIVGTQTAVLSFDPEAAAVVWRNDLPPAIESMRAWTHGSSIFLVARDRSLWRMTTTTGALDAQAIETSGRLETGGEPTIYALDESRFALASPQGLAIFSVDGSNAGADALGGDDALLAPQPGDGVLITLETGSSAREAAPPVSNLHVLDARNGLLLATAPLAMGDAPLRLALLDERIAVTAGHTTIIYKAEPRR
jgi:outer membrane protein assembly factor BamB